MKIFRQEFYEDDAGHILKVLTECVTTLAQISEVKYQGQGMITFQSGMAVQVQFDIDATTPSEAFLKYDACLQIAANKKLAEMQKQAISAAIQAPAKQPLSLSLLNGMKGRR